MHAERPQPVQLCRRPDPLLARLALPQPAEYLLTFGVPYLVLGLLEGAFANRLLRRRARRPSVITAIAVPVLAFLGLLAIYVVYPGNDYNDEIYLEEMKDGLLAMRHAQEAHFRDSAAYTDSLRFPSSRRVLLRIGTATPSGWNAGARHHFLPTHVCGIFVGTAPPPIPGARNGEPRCVELRDE